MPHGSTRKSLFKRLAVTGKSFEDSFIQGQEGRSVDFNLLENSCLGQRQDEAGNRGQAIR